jgi:hypothetical protein
VPQRVEQISPEANEQTLRPCGVLSQQDYLDKVILCPRWTALCSVDCAGTRIAWLQHKAESIDWLT